MPVEAFGQNVKRIRLAKQPVLKAIELARMMDTDPAVISRWEKGKSGLPETPTLIRLAKSLQVTVDALLVNVDSGYDAIRRDLADHGPAKSLTPQKGGVVDPASTRVLASGEDQDRRYIKALQDVLAIAGAALAERKRARAEGANARTAQPKPRRRAGGSR